ncbi:MAG: hypothetical protein AAFW67_03975, partial [Cyanobacteria bacterium J06638_38]
MMDWMEERTTLNNGGQLEKLNNKIIFEPFMAELLLAIYSVSQQRDSVSRRNLGTSSAQIQEGHLTTAYCPLPQNDQLCISPK